MNDKFVLGVDLDGVCADYTAAFAEFVAGEVAEYEPGPGGECGHEQHGESEAGAEAPGVPGQP